jgi:L-alanine-DL-glutamate epimerase-like enolase superfamily enzyme
MRIAKVDCNYLLLPLPTPVRDTPRDYGVMVVTLESDNGLKGVGIGRSYDHYGHTVRHIVRNEIGPFLMARADAMFPPEMWHEAAFDLPFVDYRAPVGVVSSALSAVDQALWDIWGQNLGIPVYRLLGGAQPEIEVYVTFGLNTYTPEEEVEAAKRVKAQGFTAFKLQGVDDRGGNVGAAVDRLARLRETVGGEAKIILDAHGNYDLYDAIALARGVRDLDVCYIDEPVRSRDPVTMRRLHESCPDMAFAARSRAGSFFDNRDLIMSGGIQLMGSNVMDQGGYSQTVKVGHLAEAFQMRMVTGGGFHMLNSHLIAALSNGWMTEYHIFAAALTERIFKDPIRPVDGRWRMSDRPGLGLELDASAVAEAKAYASAKSGEQ